MVKNQKRDTTAKEMFNRIIVVAELLSKSDKAQNQAKRQDLAVQTTQNR